MKKESNFLKSTFYIYLFVGLTAPLSYLIRVLFSQSLDLSEFGLLYSIIALITFISIFNDFGLSSSLVYYIPKFLINNQTSKIRDSIFYVFSFQLITTLTISFILFFLSGYLAENYFKLEIAGLILILSLITFISMGMISSLKSFLVGFKEIVFVNVLEFFRFFLIISFSLIVFFSYDSNLLVRYMFFWGISHVILFFSFSYLVLRKYSHIFIGRLKFDLQLFKDLFSHGFLLLLGNSISVLLTQIDLLMITFFLETSDVGLYSNAISIISILSIVTLPISLYLIPTFSELSERKNKFLMSNLINKIYIFGFILILPLSLIFFIFSSEFIVLLFSNKFLPVSEILALFGIFGIFQIFSVYNFGILNGLGKLKSRIKILSFILLVNIILNLLLIPKLEVLGAAISTIFSWVLSFILSFYLIRKEIEITFNYKKFFFIILSSIIYISILSFLTNLVNLPTLIKIPLLILIAGIIYLIMILLFKVVTVKEILSFFPDKLQIFISKYFKDIL